MSSLTAACDLTASHFHCIYHLKAQPTWSPNFGFFRIADHLLARSFFPCYRQFASTTSPTGATTIMSNDELLTDDYVADLLAKEAADHSLRYSSIGMDSSRTDKK